MFESPTLLTKRQDILAGKTSIPRKVLIYGEPTTGKTELAATVAASSHIDRIYWFDCDKSIETVIFSPRITDDMRAKIVPFDLSGSNEYPIAAETMLNGFTSRKQKKLCYTHGRIACKEPTCPSLLWSLYSLGPRDCVVIDPGSKIAEQLFAYASKINDTNNKIQWWGDFYTYMDDIQSALLDCPTNIIWVSHELDLTKTVNQGTLQEREVLIRTVPLCGSRNYSKKFSKDFGYKIVTYVDGSKFHATTTPGEYGKAIAGARRPVTLYNEQGNPSLVPMFEPESLPVEQTKPNTTGLSVNIKRK